MTKPSLIQALTACLDLTTLGENDSPERVEALCNRANAAGAAAVCVYPEHVDIARHTLIKLGSKVLVASVVNFPDGGADPHRARRECRRAIAAGAQEIDAVLPYRELLAGDAQPAMDVALACRRACADRCLKLIIESGELHTPELIAQASKIAIDAGADFIKTSTGKVPVNATLDAARCMLKVIAKGKSKGACGFKAAGGIRTVAQATEYYDLVVSILGPKAAKPRRFRLGASSLLDSLEAAAGAADQ